MKYFSKVLITLLAYVNISYPLSLQNGNVTLNFNITENDGIVFNLVRNNIVKLSGHLGAGIQLQSTKNPRLLATQDEDVQFSIQHAVDGFNIFWESYNTSRAFQDCFDLLDFEWFVGREGNPTEWPIQKATQNSSYIVNEANSISEPYWLTSIGSFIFVNETVPLFIDQNNLVKDSLCLIAKTEAPFVGRQRVLLNYTIAANDNSTEAHKNAVLNFLGRPTGMPDIKMIREPIWSTWIKYQNDLSDQLLYDFAQSVQANGFRGQVQIEDGWEDCRGALSFKKFDFASINKTIININSLAIRVTVWIHPFVEVTCEEIAQIGLANNYFAKGKDGKEIVISWNNFNSSYLVDFSNENASSWFSERVGLLIDKHTLDGFKFDAGEASLASNAALGGDPELEPNELTKVYNSLSNFTNFVHVHSGWRTQWVPVFVSIPEKEPNWSQENGLKSVLINLFQLNIAGYSMAIPGLIGGKSLERPSPELYIRWTQAVTFMPVMQFGYLPWEIIGNSYDVLAIVKKFVDLHSWYSDGIKNILIKCRTMGLPANPPIWWVDPTNPQAFKILDQYMLGENIMVAPILDEGLVFRDIYLPPGRWRDGNNGSIYEGSTTLKDYPAPIDILPYFEKERD